MCARNIIKLVSLIIAMRTKSQTKQNTILEAARQQFIAAGSYTAVNMDAIAQEAMVSKQTLYSYFATKEALFMAVVTRIIGQPWDDAFPYEAARTARTGQAYADVLFDLLTVVRAKLTNPEYLSILRIVVAESQSQPQLAALYKQQVIDRAFGGVRGLVAAGHDAGVLPIDPVIATRMLVGAMMTYVLMDGLFAQGPIRPPSDDDLRAIVSQVLKPR